MSPSKQKGNRTNGFFKQVNRLSNKREFLKLSLVVLTILFALLCVLYLDLARRYATSAKKTRVYLKELNFLQREAGGFTFYEASAYLQVDSPVIKKKASDLQTPERIYDFVNIDVTYYGSTFEDNIYAENILTTKNSNCLGQANLLCALLRDFGFAPDHCHIVYGSITKKGQEGSHAWVELYYDKQWIVLDPTGLTGEQPFGYWTKKKFYRQFKVLPIFEYNDTYSQFIPY